MATFDNSTGESWHNGFAAGAASRDAEVAGLKEQISLMLADEEMNERTIAELRSKIEAARALAQKYSAVESVLILAALGKQGEGR